MIKEHHTKKCGISKTNKPNNRSKEKKARSMVHTFGNYLRIPNPGSEILDRSCRLYCKKRPKDAVWEEDNYSWLRNIYS